jgi:release factor glutamine methyltransferase
MSRPLAAAVAEATARLESAGVPSARHDAEVLAAHSLGVDRRDLWRHTRAGEQFEAYVGRRAAREPLQHITGVAWFRHLTLQVGAGVFVPRPETEVVVDAVLAAVRGLARPRVVDLCTGSGAIALAVKDEVPQAHVYAVELAEDAHAWAARNVADTGFDIVLARGDAAAAFPELDGTVDVVVSNPPYIPVGMVPIDPEVRDHDPEVALYGGSEDGLAIPLAVAARAAALLRPGGVLVMEHADTQGTALPVALRRTGSWSSVTDQLDLTGRPRATVAVRA